MTLETETVDAVDPLSNDVATSEEVVPNLPVEDAGKEKPAQTMDETLREKYRELTAPKVEEKVAPKPDAKTEAKVTPPVEAKPGEPVRGPDGKFAKAEAPVVEPKPGEVKPAAPLEPSIAKAPTSWKGEAQAKWEALPPEIKAEVHRREADFHNGLKTYKGESDLFRVLDAEIRPYEAMIRAAGTNAQSAIRDFFNTAYQLKSSTPEGKVQTLLNIAQEYGVDLSLLPDVQEKMLQGQPVIAPEYQQLQQQFHQLSQTVAQREQAEQTARAEADRKEAENVAQEIATWSANKPHYSAVKLRMAALMESGQAQSLDDAYEQATWAHPEVRASLIAQQQEANRKLSAEKAAAAKQAASVNVTTRGTLPVSTTKTVGTMEDTLRQALKEIKARGA